MSSNKTIVIATVNPDNINDQLLLSGYKMASILPSSKPCVRESKKIDSDIPIRKRQRLDHLTADEKLLRRKLKNRVAAQSARDRKKAQMTDLEDSVKILQDENTQLIAENEALIKRNTEIEEQNRCLRLMLEERKGTTEPVTIKEEKIDEDKQVSLEYASLTSVSQQKRQDHCSLHLFWMMHLIFCHMIQITATTMTICLMSSKNSPNSWMKSLAPSNKKEKLKIMNPRLKWWGPKQKTWNPSKNL